MSSLDSHGRARAHTYNEIVDRPRIRPLTAVAALFAALFCIAPANAQTANAQLLQAGSSPVIRIQARWAELTLRAWDRAQVQIVSSAPVEARHFSAQAVRRAIPGGDVPVFGTEIKTPRGALRLQQEDFPVDGIAGSQHDGVAVLGGDSGASITVTVPADSALVLVMAGRGAVHVNGYHGALVARLHNGPIDINDSSGEAYVEAARGTITVSDSTYGRIRARTAAGNIFFSRCSAHQIEVSSIRGNIVYDNGTFAPGLARFETQQGNIALGVASGGVQIGAHSATGRIVSAFDRPGAAVSGSPTDTQAIVNGGGPVVTLNAGNGTVFLYDGSLRKNARVQQKWGARARICAGRRCRP
ncbi:MAG: hypothetical protein ABR508_05665 [Candidatus Baltobacteraceae bacterium]